MRTLSLKPLAPVCLAVWCAACCDTFSRPQLPHNYVPELLTTDMSLIHGAIRYEGGILSRGDYCDELAKQHLTIHYGSCLLAGFMYS